jgi:hypothetical protein
MAALCIMAKKAAGSGGGHAAGVSQSQFERRFEDVERGLPCGYGGC